MRETPEHGSVPAARRHDRPAIVNLRGHPDDRGFLDAAREALGCALPIEPCRTVTTGERRVVWAGPDDWFVIDAVEPPERLVRRLRDAVAGSHAAVTDVSSGYALLRLAGPSARTTLAAGCPLDLHPRAFGVGRCAGSHYFKASTWIWQSDEAPVFELLVRSSLRSYVELMLQRSAA